MLKRKELETAAHMVLVDDPAIAVAEINELLPTFFAFDTEHQSDNSGCTIIQIALLQSGPWTESKAGQTMILPKPAPRNIIVYLFNMVGKKIMPKDLEALLTNQRIVKVGCDVDSDQRVLSFYRGLVLTKTVDIQSLALSLGHQKISLQYLSRKLCGLEKMKQTKDWRMGMTWNEGTTQLICYAAYDAVLTLCVYLELINYDEKKKVTLIKPTLKQLLEFSQWLQEIFLVSNAISVKDIIIRAQNSYPALKEHYSRQDEALLIEKMLEQLVYMKHLSNNEGMIFCSVDVVEEVTPSSGQTYHELLVDTHGAQAAYNNTRVTIPNTGIKISAYAKCLANCNWHHENSESRKQMAEQVVNILVGLGLFKQVGDRLFQPH